MTKIGPNVVPYLNRVREAYVEELGAVPYARAEGYRVQAEMLREARERTDTAIRDAIAAGAVKSHIHSVGLKTSNPNRVYRVAGENK